MVRVEPEIAQVDMITEGGSPGPGRSSHACTPMAPSERRRRVAELIDQGVTSNAAIALALGIGKSTVARDKKSLGPCQNITAEQCVRVSELLAEGRPIADVASEIGCSPTEIRAKFPEFLPKRYTREEKIALLDDFEWLIGGGVWPESAAARIGMKLPAVCQWYRRLGMTMPARVAVIARAAGQRAG